MTKKSKKRIRAKAPVTLKDVAPVAPAQAKPSKTKAQSKVDQVIALCAKGVTLEEIMSALSISKPASSSLIADARRKGVDIKSERSPAGVVVYRA